MWYLLLSTTNTRTHMLLIHTNTHHTHLQSYTHQSSRSGAGHKRAVLSVGCVVRQRGCRPPRSEAAADLQQLRWPPPSLWLSPTLPPHARNERISGVMCTVAHVASTCDATSARARQSRAGPDEPSSSVVGELVVLFSSPPETVAFRLGSGRRWTRTIHAGRGPRTQSGSRPRRT